MAALPHPLAKITGFQMIGTFQVLFYSFILHH